MRSFNEKEDGERLAKDANKRVVITPVLLLMMSLVITLIPLLSLTFAAQMQEGELMVNYTVTDAQYYFANISSDVEMRQLVRLGTVPEVLEEGDTRVDTRYIGTVNISDSEGIFSYHNFTGEIVWKALSMTFNNSFGRVQFKGLVDLISREGLFNVSAAANISSDRILLNNTYSELNLTADLELYGVYLTSVIITKDGNDCLDCLIYNYSDENVSFRVPGFGLYRAENGTVIKIRISRNVTAVSSSLDIRGELYNGSYPVNVTVDIGNDGAVEFNYTGIVNDTVQSTANLTNEINSILPDCDCVGCSIENSVTCLIPITVSSDTQGTVILEELNISQVVNNFTTMQNANLTTLDIDDYFYDENDDNMNYTVVFRAENESSALLYCSMDDSTSCESGDEGNDTNIGHATGVFFSGVLINSSGNLTFNATEAINLTQGTFEAWLIPEWDGSKEDRFVIFEMNASTTADIISLYKNSSGYLVGEIWDNVGGRYRVEYNISSWLAKEKHHIAFSWQTDDMKIYTDGVLRDTLTSATMATSYAESLWLGSNAYNGHHVNATLDEAKIWNDSITEFYNESNDVGIAIDTITQILNFTSSRYYSGTKEAKLVAYDGRTYEVSNTFNVSILLDTVVPEVVLTSPDDLGVDNDGNVTLYFNATDNVELDNCSLYHNLTGSWEVNDTLDISGYNWTGNFTLTGLDDLTNVTWNVECYDIYGNNATATDSRNVFISYPISSPYEVNATVNSTEYGGLEIDWEDVAYATGYKVYVSTDMETFTLYTTVTDSNYTDIDAIATDKKYYIISAIKPGMENMSLDIIGKQNYTLTQKIGTSTINWIALTFNNTKIKTAKDLLNDIPNATSIVRWNNTLQTSQSCSEFLCPDVDCDSSTCNFNLTNGEMYHVTIDTGVSSVSYLHTGIVYNATNISMIKIAGGFGRNWISLDSNTTLVNAKTMLRNITNSEETIVATAVSRWDAVNQRSQGFISLFGGIGTNFVINPEEGYEVSVSESINWTQR